MRRHKAGGGAPRDGGRKRAEERACPPLTCKRLVLDALIDYEDGTIARPLREEFERHLALCPPCLKFLDSYRATGRALTRLKPREIPPTLARTVLQFVKARCRRS